MGISGWRGCQASFVTLVFPDVDDLMNVGHPIGNRASIDRGYIHVHNEPFAEEVVLRLHNLRFDPVLSKIGGID